MDISGVLKGVEQGEKCNKIVLDIGGKYPKKLLFKNKVVDQSLIGQMVELTECSEGKPYTINGREVRSTWWNGEICIVENVGPMANEVRNIAQQFGAEVAQNATVEQPTQPVAPPPVNPFDDRTRLEHRKAIINTCIMTFGKDVKLGSLVDMNRLINTITYTSEQAYRWVYGLPMEKDDPNVDTGASGSGDDVPF